MRPVNRRFRALPFALVLVLAACSGDGEDTPTATVPTTVETPTTAAPSDPYAIPAVIDVAYVQRVFDALDQIRGEVVKEFLTKRQLTPEMGARLGTVYNPTQLERELGARVEQLGQDFSVFKQAPGIRRTLVRRILTARTDCISVVAEYDNTAVLKNPRPPTPTYLALEPTNASSDPANNNPTPYSIFQEDKDFDDPCAGQ